MKLIDTELHGVKILEPSVFGDHRGWFMETYSDTKLKEAGMNEFLFKIISLLQQQKEH